MKEYKDYIEDIKNCESKDFSKLPFINDYDVLNMRDQEGVPIAFVLSNAGYIFDDRKILSIRDSGSQSARMQAEMADRNYVPYRHESKSLATFMARNGHEFTDIEILKDPSVSKAMIENGCSFTEEQILKIHTEEFPIAHEIFTTGVKFESEDILLLKDKNGNSIAHLLAQEGHEFEDLNIIKLKNKDGVSVAEHMARQGFIFRDKEILLIENRFGESVASIQAEKGYISEDIDILKLKNRMGDSIAYIQASKGWKTEDKEILTLKNHNGSSVAEIYAKEGKVFTDPDIYKQYNNQGKPVAYYMAKCGNPVFDYDVLSTLVSVKVPAYQVSHSKDRYGRSNANYSDKISVTILDVLMYGKNVDFNVDDVKNNADLLSLRTSGNGAPLATMMFNDYDFVPALDVAKKMNPNSLILLIEAAFKGLNRDGAEDKFKHLLNDKELLLTSNSKNYSIALAFSKAGIKFEDPEIVELLKPKSAINWRRGVFPSGANKGKTFGDIADSNPNYLAWCHENQKYDIHKFITKEDIDNLVANKGNQENVDDSWKNKTFTRGKNNGKTFIEVLESNPKYMQWCHSEKAFDVDKLVPLEEINKYIEIKKSKINVSEKKAENINVVPKESNSKVESWEDMVINVGKFKGKTLGELCNTKMAYVTYMYDQGMELLTKNIPSDVIDSLRNNESLKAYQDKKEKSFVRDAGELDI